MIRRLVIAATAALCAAATSLPADAAAPVKVYLNQASEACGSEGASWVITTSPSDGGPCIMVPRLQVNGTGYDAGSESFVSVKKMKTVRLDATKPVTGSFSLFSSGPLTSPDGVGLVGGDFVIKIARQKIGTVHVEGVASPTIPATAKFSFKLPKSLHNVKTNSFTVTHTWTDCVGLCAVKVSGVSFMSVPVR